MIGAVTSVALGLKSDGAQVGRHVIPLELGDEPEQASIAGDEVIFVAEAPQIPVQVRGNRDRDWEGYSSEGDVPRNRRRLVVVEGNVGDAELVLPPGLHDGPELHEVLVREPEFANEVDCWNPRGRKSPRLNLNSWCWLPEHQAEFDVEVLGRGRVRYAELCLCTSGQRDAEQNDRKQSDSHSSVYRRAVLRALAPRRVVLYGQVYCGNVPPASPDSVPGTLSPSFSYRFHMRGPGNGHQHWRSLGTEIRD